MMARMVGEMSWGYALGVVLGISSFMILAIALGVAFEKFEDRDRDRDHNQS